MRLKKVKNARERLEKSKYFVNNPYENRGKWDKIFNNSNPIHIEIGMGKGNFMINMAKLHSNVNFVGIEMYDSVLVKATQKLELEDELSNLKLILIDASNIEDVFDKEVARIYLNFSDPWPKAKHYKRRLTSKLFLDRYEKIFKDKKEIFQKTDNDDLFEFSISSLEEAGYKLENITRDLHAGVFLGNVMTEYEEKFSAKGIKINRLEAYKE